MKQQNMRREKSAGTRTANLAAAFGLALLLATAGMVASAVPTNPGGGGGAPGAADAALEAAHCASLVSLSLPDMLVTSATVVPATPDVPEYCRVLGALEKTILFEVDLPTAHWNGKFFYAGGGGFNGSIPALTHGVARGYAAAGSDTGHQGDAADASWALNNPQAQINYGWRATHLVAGVAKEIVRGYYGRKAQRSYWLGCSNGGKMGLMEAQRFPDDFEGIVIGNFVIDRTRLMMQYTWNAQALAAAPIPQYKIPAIEKATLAACDGKDGLTDGLIDRPDRCAFDPKTLQCSGADGPECLTAGQVKAVEKIYQGPRTADGRQLFPGFSPGHEDDWAAYITGFGSMHAYPASTWKLQDQFWRYFAFGPAFDSVTQFDFDKTPGRLAQLQKDQDAYQPDLSTFFKRGGKLIMYHGWADHSIPPLRTIQYYTDIRKTMGAETADRFVRLFLVPGLHHCTGGPGPVHYGGRGQQWLKDDPEYDIVRALDQWVEKDIAPAKLIGVRFKNNNPKQGAARSRPLCPYPQVAKYTGSGSVDEAASFVCAT